MASRAAQVLLALRAGYLKGLRAVVLALAVVSGIGFMAMVAATCASVVAGAIGRSLSGVEDFVAVVGGIAVACALPYTTAVKGHVAVEYFFHKLGRTNRIIGDTILRALGVSLFVMLAWGCYARGTIAQDRGTTTPTLQIPEFWSWYVTAGCCAVVALTIFAHMIRPGRELVRP